jgi:5-methyltetrahydropteroyltriglutamate--homocysteine methyltransferase
MKRTRPPFRADHVGSLLRPAALQEAKLKFARGEITAAQRKAVEDREVARIIDKQQEIGLDSVTDGEFRRAMWHRDFLQYLTGVAEIDTDKPFDWGGVKGAALNLRIAGKLDFPLSHPHLDHFRFVKDRTSATAKMTIPSPSVIAPAKLFDMQDARAPAYRDLDALYEDLCAAYRKAVQAFYDAGCRYLQIDEVRMVAVADPNFRATRGLSDDDFERLIALFDRLVSGALRDRPADMTVTMHNCRGNFRSRWAAQGSYEPVAERLFNIRQRTRRRIRAAAFSAEAQAGGTRCCHQQVGDAGTQGCHQAPLRRGDKICRPRSAVPVAAMRLCLDRRRQRGERRPAMGQARIREGNRRRGLGPRLISRDR